MFCRTARPEVVRRVVVSSRFEIVVRMDDLRMLDVGGMVLRACATRWSLCAGSQASRLVKYCMRRWKVHRVACIILARIQTWSSRSTPTPACRIDCRAQSQGALSWETDRQPSSNPLSTARLRTWSGAIPPDVMQYHVLSPRLKRTKHC